MFSLSLTVWNKARCIRHCLETAGRFDMPFSTKHPVGYSVHEPESALSQVKKKRQWPMPNRGRDNRNSTELSLGLPMVGYATVATGLALAIGPGPLKCWHGLNHSTIGNQTT